MELIIASHGREEHLFAFCSERNSTDVKKLNQVGGCQHCYIISVLGWQNEWLIVRPEAVLKERALHSVMPPYEVGLPPLHVSIVT